MYHKAKDEKETNATLITESFSDEESPSPVGATRDDPDDKHTKLYKTELCKNYTETGNCRYGGKCRFAHGEGELREVQRHPRYKTEQCRAYSTTGTCQYGTRCTFIHDPMSFRRQIQQRESSSALSAAAAAATTTSQRPVVSVEAQTPTQPHSPPKTRPQSPSRDPTRELAHAMASLLLVDTHKSPLRLTLSSPAVDGLSPTPPSSPGSPFDTMNDLFSYGITSLAYHHKRRTSMSSLSSCTTPSRPPSIASSSSVPFFTHWRDRSSDTVATSGNTTATTTTSTSTTTLDRTPQQHPQQQQFPTTIEPTSTPFSYFSK